MTLREALEYAHDQLDYDEARTLIKALLDQKVDNEHKTLVDECEFIIFG